MATAIQDLRTDDTTTLRRQWRDHLDHMLDLGSTLEHDQKLCDAADLHDPALDYVLREMQPFRALRNNRSWEYAMTIAALGGGDTSPRIRSASAWAAGLNTRSTSSPTSAAR